MLARGDACMRMRTAAQAHAGSCACELVGGGGVINLRGELRHGLAFATGNLRQRAWCAGE